MGLGKRLRSLSRRAPRSAPGNTASGGAPPQTTPGSSDAPKVDTPVVSNVTTHQATITSTVSAGVAPATTWVEYGPTTRTARRRPVSLAAGSSQKVPVTLSSLSAAVHYFAHVVVFSPAGRVTSPDVTFSTLTDTKVVRVATAGDIACDPNRGQLQRRPGNRDRLPPIRGLERDPGRRLRRRPAARRHAVQRRHGAPSPRRTTRAGAASNAIAHPVVGNHEYGRPAAGPYFQYFGAAAGTPGQGWYSYELGAWHVVALNANCARIAGGCGVGSPQELWLRADLAAHPTGCTLAYWHQPLFTSGQEPSTPEVAAFWNDLFAAGAELVLNGHEHVYERFAPQTAGGSAHDAHGMREFIVGTGGENHMSFHATPAANSEVRDKTSFGFLELDLSNGAYSWAFRPTAPDAFTDSGTGTCH